MVMMKSSIKGSTLSLMGGISIGLLVGLALIASSVHQGKCCLTAIQAAAKQPAIYGKPLFSPFS